MSILVVRLGAMGDIIHALPAVASLRDSFPGQRIAWLLAPRWMPLIEGNPAIDQMLAFERKTVSQIRSTYLRVRQWKPALAFDFQGLIQSALAGRLAGPQAFWGFSREIAREPLASLFYTNRVNAPAEHRVERNLQLVEAAGASRLTSKAWIPHGQPDSTLPDDPFVLASPFAGWAGKEWPLQNYPELARLLRRDGLSLLLNVPASRAPELQALPDVVVQSTSLPGLIYTTRQAAAVIGLDSGPLHLAAALNKPGVAIFGPTDPAATGPYGHSITVLRAPDVATTYKRHKSIHRSMEAVSVDQVHTALLASIQKQKMDANQTGQWS